MMRWSQQTIFTVRVMMGWSQRTINTVRVMMRWSQQTIITVSNLESCYHSRNSNSLRLRTWCDCRTLLDMLYNIDIYGRNLEIINIFVLFLENSI